MLGTEEREIEKWVRRALYFVSCLTVSSSVDQMEAVVDRG